MIKISSVALNDRYHRLLKEYMEEMQFKDLFGKKMNQRQVCQTIIMDFLDLYDSDKNLEKEYYQEETTTKQ